MIKLSPAQFPPPPPTRRDANDHAVALTTQTHRRKQSKETSRQAHSGLNDVCLWPCTPKAHNRSDKPITTTEPNSKQNRKANTQHAPTQKRQPAHKTKRRACASDPSIPGTPPIWSPEQPLTQSSLELRHELLVEVALSAKTQVTCPLPDPKQLPRIRNQSMYVCMYVCMCKCMCICMC